MRTSHIVVEDFYVDPFAVRDYALRQRYYYPYQRDDAIRSGRAAVKWMSSWFREASECPFKSSTTLIESLETITHNKIDMDHWKMSFPYDAEGKATADCTEVQRTCFWNCSFHLKPQTHQPPGTGVHNHVTDIWNSVGEDGWAGIVYLDPNAPIPGGLRFWRNKDSARNYDWMTPAEHWEQIDEMGNVFNRLILARGNLPHSGAAGWGTGLKDGRLFQTFFFKIRDSVRFPGLNVSLHD